MTIHFESAVTPTLGEGLAVATGAYSVKQIMSGKWSGLLKGAVVGAGSALLMRGKWELAGVAASIGTAASGWNDLSKMKIKSGLTKLFMGSAMGLGTDAVMRGREFGAMRLKDAGLLTATVAAAGLVQASVEAAWPYIVQGFKCAARTIKCCDKTVDAVSDCFRTEKTSPRGPYSPREEGPRSGAAVSFF